MNRLRLLVDQPADAAWNMAVDEALLRLAEEPTLRLYGWAPHAVSLGYFQRAADFADLPESIGLVRRLTGGGAIHHGDEVTFSLALDAELLPAEIAASYAVVHDAAIAALVELGIECERLAAGQPQQARPQHRWCFAEPGRDDIVTARGKLLGSAQRRVARPRARVLHHGSLVLRRPSLTPFVAAATDAIEVDSGLVDRLHDLLAAHLAVALHRELAPGKLSDAERCFAEQLREQRYSNPAFTHRL